MSNPIWTYCPCKDDEIKCGGTCSQEGMPNCPWLLFAELKKKEVEANEE